MVINSILVLESIFIYQPSSLSVLSRLRNAKELKQNENPANGSEEVRP